MFELLLAATPDEPNGAFWTFSNLFHIFNHCNPPGIVDIYLFALFIIFILLLYDCIHINIDVCLKLVYE